MKEDKDLELAYKSWESQNDNGEVIKAMQKEKAKETVRYWSDQYVNARRARQKEREECKSCFDYYVGIYNKHWSDRDVKSLENQLRIPTTFNVVKSGIDKVFGSLVSNPNEVYFSPVNSNENADPNIITSLYEYDFERGNYKKELDKFKRDALIHTGVLEMFKDYRHSKLGNIGIRSINRYLDIEFDPYWNSDNISDCKVIFKTQWKTAREIKDKHSEKVDEIDQAIRLYEQLSGSTYDVYTPEELALRDSEFYESTDGRFKIIEVIYMQTIKKKKYLSRKLDRFLEENENPETMRSQDDTIVEFEEFENVCKVMTMVPGIDCGLILQEGDHPIQIGRLPFFVLSYDNTMGVRQGLVSGLKDAQNVINKRQSMIIANQMTNSNSGLFVKESFFKDKNESQRFVLERNIPGKTFFVSDDVKMSDGVMAIPQSPPPQGLFEQVQWADSFVEKYLNVTDAVSGRSGGANESGVVFESKRNQSQVAHVGIIESISQIEKDMAEGYFYASKVVYKGVNRKLTNPKTGKVIEINKKVPLEDSQINEGSIPGVNGFLSSYKTINDISKMPRHDVVIKKSRLGMDQKQRSLSIFSEMQSRSINPILKSLYEKAMVPLLEIPESLIPDMEAAVDVFVELQKAQVMNNIKLLNDGMTQSDVNTKMLLQQAGGQQQAQQAGLGQAMDARSAGNTPGMGNLPDSIAQDMTGTNNKSGSDI